MADWKFPLFSCFGDFGACCYAWCCGPCAAGEIYEKAELGSCMVGCLLVSFVGCLYPCLITSKVRERQNIEGSLVSDTLLCCCCSPCQMTRELREVRAI